MRINLQNVFVKFAAALALGVSLNGYAADLSVSAYTWAPDPVVSGGASTFTVTTTNNDVASAVSSLTLSVDLPSNVSFDASVAPAGCAFNLSTSPKTLTCTHANLAAQDTWVLAFDGIGQTAGVQNTAAAISAAGNTDTNPGNDVLIKQTTVIAGADLGVLLTGPNPVGCTGAVHCAATAGATLSFNIVVPNAGPNAATTFRVVTNLPAVVDFTYQSATGSGWSCSAAGTTLTCDYSGAPVASGANAPAITVTGRIITTAGSITLGSSVASTDAAVGDPVSANNGPSQVIVDVTPGTDLRANKSMVSATTGMTTLISGEAVTLTLSATNTGTQQATGVTVSDVVPADFTIGTLPGGCGRAGQTITCSVGTLDAATTSSSFAIPLTTVGATGVSGSNIANVARTGPAGGVNNSATTNYSIVAAFAHLTLSKSKGPTPVAAGGNITNTIVVTNSSTSTSAATGTIRVTDTLSANETFVSASPASWACSASGSPQTVTCDYAGANLARSASLPTLTLTTKAAAGYLGTLSNTACTGMSVSSPHLPADNATTNNCDTRSVMSTPLDVDLSITKAATPASPSHVLTTDNSFTYTLAVTNAGPDTAPTVNVSDSLQAWYSSTTGSAVVTVGSGTCSFGATTACTLLNLASGETRTILITVNRPVQSGAINNTATVSSPDAVDSNGANNSASAAVIIDAIADVAVTGIANSPEPVKVGVAMTYTTSIKNNGPNTAQGVVLRHTIDDLRMTYVAGSASLTGSGGTCSFVSAFSGAPYAGKKGIECTGFTLADGESRQLTFKVIPVYPYPDAIPAAYVSNAYVTTTTVESDAPGYANNGGGNTASITLQALDLSITNNDPGYDPVAFGDSIIYQVKAQNNGPSQATGLQVSVTPNAPAGGSPAAYTMLFNGAGSSLPSGATCSQPGGAGTAVLCYLGASRATSVMAVSSSAVFNLKFDTGPVSNTPASSMTYATTAAVASYESDANYDALPGNNVVSETTTVLPKTDLIVISKTVSKPVVDLNETFTYSVVVGNKGPSDAAGITITDVLPAGLVMAGNATASAAGGFLTTNSCSAPASGSSGTVTCAVGPIPADATTANLNKQVVVSIPVRAAYQASGTYAFAFNSNITNAATVAPQPNTSVDTVSGNDTNSVVVQVRKNAIAGFVYADNDLNDAMDATGGEGVNSVTLTLTGTDSYGYTYGPSSTYAAPTKTTSGSGASTGAFLFDNLPPGTWTLVETQPSGYYDRFEVVGSAGGAAPAATCDGTTNCSNAVAANTISGLSLPANTATAATGYLFQEYRRAQLGGNVYLDANNDGIMSGAGENSIASVAVTLSGTAYSGVNICSLVTCTTTTNAGGAYSFAALPPSDGGGYAVTETQPASYLAGKTAAGSVSGSGSVVGNVPSLYGNLIQGVIVRSNGSSVNNNFGELQGASIAGAVFIDANTNAVKDGGETIGVSGVTLTLTGTDDQGNSVNLTTTSGVSGAYSFTGLRPGSYTVTETPLPGLTHTGAQAGTLGGSGQPSGAALPGAGVLSITTITVPAGNTATGYNFGESGQGLSGNVYVDLNGNGVMDAGEPGIAGVQMALSGTAASGNSVCAEISPNPCVVTTNAGGAYNFLALPASNGAGYTLTEQSQASAPLSNYTDGTDAVGSLGGTAGNDVLSAIVIGLGQVGANYNFGERSASLSGAVYLDVNNNGANDAGDAPLSGVTVTLSGTTATGVNVCTVAGVSCTATTDASGNFSFAGLPKANGSGYTLTETQPGDYADRSNTAGLAGGNVSVTNVISAIALGAGTAGTGYLFGEKTGSLSGNVYHDANNDGSRGGGEAGIGSVTLTLTGISSSGAVVSTTTTTAADGSYSFTGLKNANGSGYSITEAQPAAYLDGKVSKGLVNSVSCAACNTTAANVISAIPFVAANAFTGFDFGEVQSAGLSGKVYLDLNDNGLLDGVEAGIADVTVTLTGSDDRGVAVNLTLVTAADGSFSFSNLRPSNATGYTVTETQPADYIDRSNTAGTAGGTPGSNVFTGVVIASGASAGGYLFGEKGGALSGYVYYDANDDGIRAASGEPGVAGVTLTLSGTSASGVAVNVTTATAADGSYRFTGLKNSDGAGYALTETQPATYLDGKLSKGLVNGVSCAACNTSTTNVIRAIAMNATNTYTAFNFGELLGASIGGKVYIDANNNGTQDSGEAGIAGVTVSLTGTDSLGAAVSLSTTTAANGSYNFSGLRPSNASGYILVETQPAGYLDGRETAGTGAATAGSVDNTTFDATATHNRISGIVLAPGQTGIDYLFGEQGGTLSGHVYVDGYASGTVNGSKDTAEPGLPNVRIYLSGTTASGSNVCSILPSCTVATDASGRFSFVVPPGTYTLVEEQSDVRSFVDPASATTRSLSDARETAGVAGGSVDNSGFGNNLGYNTIANILVDAATMAANAGNMGGYLFGERVTTGAAGSLVPPVVSGYVYLDAAHTRVRGSAQADPRVTGWTATLTASRSDGSTEVLCSVQTDATGYYHLDNLSCAVAFPQWAGGLPVSGQVAPGTLLTYTTFSVSFNDPGVNGAGIVTVPQSGGSVGTADPAGRRITGITLRAGDVITEQNLPLDPSGVVYDAVTRAPVGNAVVTLLEGGAPVDANCLVSGQNPVITGSNGFYQFLLQLGGRCSLTPGVHTFSIAVTPPSGYAPGVSSMIPPMASAFVPPTLGGVEAVQPQSVPPAGTQATTYYLSLTLTLSASAATSSSSVVNNHIPLDPVSAGLILVTKTSPLLNVARGDLVPYTVTATNNVAMTLANINLVDLIPPGFRYRSGSAVLNGVHSEPTVNGRTLSWRNLTFAANERKTWKMILVVGAGVGDGEYINQAWAASNLTGGLESNTASAAVRVVPDPNFDCSDIIGKVFDDKNANGYQDQGEGGIANVRIATPRGLLVTTDAEGRFHVTCADVPNQDRGSNFVMKLDERTLPSGYRITTENPRDVRLTRGKMVKLNFGATVHRVVRLELNGAAFNAGDVALQSGWTRQLEMLTDQLKGRPSVLRIAYGTGADSPQLARQRLDAVAGRLRELWMQQETEDKEKRYPLVIETELEGAK